MDKIIILPIIFVVALLTMGMVLSTNELISKNSAPDYLAHTNHDSQPVYTNDSNKIVCGDYNGDNSFDDLEDSYLDYNHEVLFN